jgi:hypothetical protein
MISAGSDAPMSKLMTQVDAQTITDNLHTSTKDGAVVAFNLAGRAMSEDIALMV